MFKLTKYLAFIIFIMTSFFSTSIAHDKNKKVLAKTIFGNFTSPARTKVESIGKYNKGCLNGGVELPVKGETWQIINSKRGRNWGHPELISFTKSLSVEAKKIGWEGLYIGDLGNPRGGPTPYGHVSHQVGLEVDIKMKPPGQLHLSLEESNNDHRYGKPLFKELDVVTRDRKNVNKNWTKQHMAIIKAAAKNAKVNKIFVNPAIKVWLCENEGSSDRKWLMKVRPEKGHREHFHVRLKCPKDSPNCVNTPLWNKYKNIDGCDKQLMWWVTDRLKPKPKKKKAKKKILIKKKYKCGHVSCYLPEDLPQQCIRTMHLQ